MTLQPNLDAGTVRGPSSDEGGSSRDLFAAYQTQTVFGSLDALRAFAILAVVWHHALLIPAWFFEAVPGAGYGFLGVDLFFVLSGFLIVTLLLRERDGKGQISLKNFYARRALRIFPLYYGMLAALAILFFVVRRNGAGARDFAGDLPYLLLYLTNWTSAHGFMSVAWSLAAEEQFYVFWPPVERFARLFAVPLVVAIIVLSELIQFGGLDDQLWDWFRWGPREPSMLRQTTFAPICLGVLLAHVLHRRPAFEALAKLFARPAAAPVLFAALLIGAQFYPRDVSGAPRFLTHLLMTAFLASVVMREDHGLSSLLTAAPLVKIGALSYGIYLLHLPVIGAVNALFDKLGVRPPFGDVVLAIPLVVAVAALSHRYYERPFLALKRRFV
jgi:peptidoglycan/LPS O-acetylase OafA/YrhL